MEKQGFPDNIVDTSHPPPYNYGSGNMPYPASGEYPAMSFGVNEKALMNPGVQNPGYQAESAYCTQPQGHGGQQHQPRVVYVQAEPLGNPPRDHLIYSIFVTVCCCWMIGIFAIIRAAECRSAASAGDRKTAELKSRQAKKLANASLGLGIVSVVCSIVLFAVYFSVLLPRVGYQ